MKFIWSNILYNLITSPNIHLRVLVFISVHATTNKIIRGFLVMLLHQGVYGGGLVMIETRGNLRHPDVYWKHSLFFLVQSRGVPPEHTHIFTSCPLPWYSRNIRVDIFSCLSLITRCQKFKVRPVLSDVSVEDDLLKCALTLTYLALLASWYPLVHTIPTSSC